MDLLALTDFNVDYVAAYPDVQLEIIAEDRFIDPLAESYDLIIRANPDPSTDLSGRCFLRDKLVVAAAPALQRPAETDVQTMVPAVSLPGQPTEIRWRLDRHDGAIDVHAKTVLQLSSMAMIHDAVLAVRGPPRCRDRWCSTRRAVGQADHQLRL
jgi:hypothetical protein